MESTNQANAGIAMYGNALEIWAPVSWIGRIIGGQRPSYID